MKNMRILNVIPLKKGLLRGNLTYFSAKDIPHGSLVTIMLRNKKTLGLVVSSEDATEAKTDIKDLNFGLKKIIDVKGPSVFVTEYMESIFLATMYFGASENNAITSLIPAIFREEYDKFSKIAGEKNNTPKERKNSLSEKLLLQEPIADRVSVYKTLIREKFAEGKSVFVVLPTENDIEKFSEYLAKGIEGFTSSIHGGLSGKKILSVYESILETNHPVLIIGTAPFLSIPRRDIGVIILEHESSSGYRMITRPYFDLRVFVEIFASKINAKFIIGDTLLRFETIAQKEAGEYGSIHPLSFRTNWNGEIRIDSERSTKKNIPSTDAKAVEFKLLPDSTIHEIKKTLARGKSVFIFALRKGLATVTVCRDCGEMVLCPTCRAPLVLYKVEGEAEYMYVCNRCSQEKNSKTVCENCHSWNLNPFGIGTQTVVEYIEKVMRDDKEFPKTKIFLLDKESAKTKKGAGKIAQEFEEHPGSILVGTEMALFYIKHSVALSIVASFDSLWSIPNFKMSEKVIQLTLSIIGKTLDTLIIHTKNANDPAILALKDGNLLSFIRNELQDRKKLGYPPYKRFVKIRYASKKNEVAAVQRFLRDTLEGYKPLIFNGFIREAHGKEVTNALVKLEPDEWKILTLPPYVEVDQKLLRILKSLPIAFDVFVDPEDLL